MTDDSKQQAGSSPLASGIGAPEFVPSSQMQFVRNNNTVNAASYVPGADRGFPATLGIDASPFVPSANGLRRSLYKRILDVQGLLAAVRSLK